MRTLALILCCCAVQLAGVGGIIPCAHAMAVLSAPITELSAEDALAGACGAACRPGGVFHTRDLRASQDIGWTDRLTIEYSGLVGASMLTALHAGVDARRGARIERPAQGGAGYIAAVASMSLAEARSLLLGVIGTVVLIVVARGRRQRGMTMRRA
jgi:hypothetical protein